MIPEIPRIFILAGPTGIGKTAVSTPLALALNAEIISADSRQIYREMDIATAKPTVDELSGIPHHFIDIVAPDEIYDAGRFGADGRKTALEIASRKKNILVVGGSGLYIQSLIDGFFSGAEKNESLREAIRREISRDGLSSVYETLRNVDPETAENIHPNDAKRIERALEVYRITGMRISELRRNQNREPWCRPIFAGLTMERALLYRRIEERVDRMIERGVIGETQTLLDKGYSSSAVAMEGLGYRDIVQYLNGDIGYEEMIRRFKQKSRNYAKRQITWFGKDKRIQWFDVQEYKTKEALAAAILRYFAGASL